MTSWLCVRTSLHTFISKFQHMPIFICNLYSKYIKNLDSMLAQFHWSILKLSHRIERSKLEASSNDKAQGNLILNLQTLYFVLLDLKYALVIRCLHMNHSQTKFPEKWESQDIATGLQNSVPSSRFQQQWIFQFDDTLQLWNLLFLNFWWSRRKMVFVSHDHEVYFQASMSILPINSIFKKHLLSLLLEVKQCLLSLNLKFGQCNTQIDELTCL